MEVADVRWDLLLLLPQDSKEACGLPVGPGWVQLQRMLPLAYMLQETQVPMLQLTVPCTVLIAGSQLEVMAKHIALQCASVCGSGAAAGCMRSGRRADPLPAQTPRTIAAAARTDFTCSLL